MRESAVFRSLIGVQGKTELFDSAESLEFCRVDDGNDQGIIGLGIVKQDDIVNRIAVSTFGHWWNSFCKDQF